MTNINEEEFLNMMARHDSLLDHNIEECGQCYYNYINAQVARDMILSGDTGNGAINRWEEETRRRWQNGKYFKLYVEEINAGRDPHKAFEDRGWII